MDTTVLEVEKWRDMNVTAASVGGTALIRLYFRTCLRPCPAISEEIEVNEP